MWGRPTGCRMPLSSQDPLAAGSPCVLTGPTACRLPLSPQESPVLQELTVRLEGGAGSQQWEWQGRDESPGHPDQP